MNCGTRPVLILVYVSAERKAYADERMKRLKRLRKMQKLRSF